MESHHAERDDYTSNLFCPNPGVLADVPALHGPFWPLDRDRNLKAAFGDFHLGRRGETWMARLGQLEIFQRRCPPAMLLSKEMLSVVDPMQEMPGRTGEIRPELHLAYFAGGELHVAPGFRPVHVDHALRRPHPIVFFRSRDFTVFAVDDLVLPLDAREIDAPLVAAPGRCRL